MRDHGLRAAVFVGNFGLAKAAAYFGPLLLAHYLRPGIYGGVEFAWSVAAFAATLLGAGIPMAVPQLTLLQRSMPMVDLLALSVAIPGGAAVVTALAVLAINPAAASTALALACIPLALAQAALSVYCRTLSHRNWAAWVEGLATHLVVAAVLCLILLGAATAEAAATSIAGVAVVIVIAAAAFRMHTRTPDMSRRLRTALRVGLPMLAYSLCAVWLPSSGRIYLGLTLPAQDVATYSFCFRLGSGLLLLHAVVATGLFARLYGMKTRAFDRYLSVYFGLIAVCCVVTITLFPLVLKFLPMRAVAAGSDASTVFPIVMLQIFAWLCSAPVELRVYRARCAIGAARWTLAAVGLTGSIIICAHFTGGLSLHLVAWLLAVQMLASITIQLSVLWRRGLKMPRIAIVCAAGTVLIAGFAVAYG